MTLEARIEDHRHLYRQDLNITRLVSRQPPTTLDPNTGELHVEPGAAVGMPMSGRLLRYLGHPEGYGGDFPWTKALWLMRRECRAKHRHHRGPRHWNGSLCHQLTVFVVVHGYSAHNAARILEYDNPEPVLRWAFGEIERQIDEQRARQEKREREASGYGPGAVPLPEWEHKPLEGLHRAECPQCRKEDVA